jgi:hypothetical protein
MNKIIPIVLLFGGLSIFSSSMEKAFTKGSAPMEYKSTITSSSMMESKQTGITSIIQSVPAPKKQFYLENVNGISLYDDVKAVIDKLGKPLSKGKDPNFAELEVYAYPEMNIAFSDGIVNYVEVLVTAGTVKIDGVPIPIEPESLKKALGEPDFVAEDGIVFQRNAALVKLFTDIKTHDVTSIHYYHHSNI